MSKIKDAWDEYGSLIMVLGAVVGAICTAAIFVAALVLNNMIDTRIADKVGTTTTVQALTTSVALNTDAIDDLGGDVNELTEAQKVLSEDIKDTLRILATQ